MSTSTRRLTRWAVAAAGVLSFGLLGVAAPASATNDGPNLDPNRTGSITVHKFEEPADATNLANDGTVVDTTGLKPLRDVKFTVQRVEDIDLGTNAGWDAAEALAKRHTTVDDHELEVGGRSLTTGTDGTATFDGLEVGLYLVSETGHGGNPIARSAEPFLVSIPLASADNTWLYDVHVYPKNSVTSIDKQVDDSAAAGLGDTVTWTVTADVPHLPDGQLVETFRIDDELDSRLRYKSATVELHGALLVKGEDYTLTTPEGSGGTVSLDFITADVAGKLDAAQGKTVTLTIVTEVISIGDGTIENDATVFVNDFEGITTEAVTSWGALKVVKYASADNDERDLLAGADFQVFRTKADAEAKANPVSVADTTTFTTNAKGEVLVEGLKAGTYWIVETKVPVGYTGTEAPIKVEVEAGSLEDARIAYVQNWQKPAFELPLTGAAGTVLFTMAGIGLIAVAVGAAMRQRSRAAAVAA